MKEFIIREKYNIAIIVIYLLLFFGGVHIGYSMNQDSADSLTEGRVTYLCMGVDKQVGMGERHPETNSIGQADVIMLISVDKANKKIDMLTIPRDTMVTMKKYNHKMQFLGVEKDQICLQYAFADGMENSCELTKECVEKLFPNVQIDGYVSLNIEAFTQINDAVGGVEVTVNDPLIALHMGVPVGTTLTLMGEQAHLYLRIRDTAAEGSAYTRIDRIKEYITKIIPKGIEVIKKDPKTIGEIFDALEEHMITDVSPSDLISLAPELLDGALENVNMYTLEGTFQMGEDGCEEFYVEEEELRRVEALLQ